VVATFEEVESGRRVAAVAVVARWLEPSLPWAAAVALGAIVAPPDAAAAAALRQVRLPHRVTVILEDEGLLNDATALLIYRVAISAAAAGITAWTVPLLVLAAVGGVALGVVLARAETARAALDALTAGPDGSGPARLILEQEYRARLDAPAQPDGGTTDPTSLAALRRLALALAAERARLAALRREEWIGDDAFHQVEEELDWAEADVGGRSR
jgi:hypothetical protein